MPNDTIKRTERGWAGHFIAASRCQFRRNTLVTLGDVNIVVSTVGAMKHENVKTFLEVGAGRHFETMCFYAEDKDGYLDADVSRPVEVDSLWYIQGVGPTSDLLANNMHENVVGEIVRRMTKGDFKTPIFEVGDQVEVRLLGEHSAVRFHDVIKEVSSVEQSTDNSLWVKLETQPMIVPTTLIRHIS